MEKKTFAWGLFASLYLMTSATAVRGQEAEAVTETSPQHAAATPPSGALVPTLNASGRATGKTAECNFLNELQRKTAFTESEEMVAKLFIATALTSQKYEEVRNSPAMQNIQIGEGAYAPYVKALLMAHDSYTRSSHFPSDGQASRHFGAVSVAHLPPAVVALFGGSFYHNGGAATPSGRRFGLSLMASAAITTSLIHSGRSSGAKALTATAGELPIDQQKSIKDNLDQGIAEPTQYLGDTLKWTPDQRAQFSRALRKKVMDTFVKTVEGMEIRNEFPPTPFSGRIPIEPKVVANLAAIDFLDLVESENLATKDEMNALRMISDLHAISQKLHGEMTPTEAKAALGQSGSVAENMNNIARLNRLLASVEKETTGTAAKAEVAKLRAESDQAIATLRKLCDIGLE
jgi:hypothetical protein